MSGRVVAPVKPEASFPAALPISALRGIVGAIDKPLLVSDRAGRLLAINEAAKHFFGFPVNSEVEKLNVFDDLFKWDATEISEELAAGKGLLDREIEHATGRKLVRVRPAAESDWLVTQ